MQDSISVLDQDLTDQEIIDLFSDFNLIGDNRVAIVRVLPKPPIGKDGAITLLDPNKLSRDIGSILKPRLVVGISHNLIGETSVPRIGDYVTLNAFGQNIRDWQRGRYLYEVWDLSLLHSVVNMDMYEKNENLLKKPEFSDNPITITPSLAIPGL